MSQVIDDIELVAVRGEPAATEVVGVEFDSRKVGPGSLFCCVPGEHTDGHLFAGLAVRQGATGLLCDRPLDLPVTQIQVPAGAVRPAMAQVAAAFYGHPSRALTMVGVTGTNGKTTVTRLVGELLEHAGIRTGVIGTLDGARTTPESPDLQRRLHQFRSEDRAAVAMEVSSHALTQERVDAIVFDVAAFTNLSRDHLDHHGSMEAYFEAKADLFDPARSRVAVINVDDPWGRRLADRLEGSAVIEVRRADAGGITSTVGRSTFTWRGFPVSLPLTGTFNVDNALLAAAVALELGVNEELVASGLSSVHGVPGRMQVVADGSPCSVVVDYAHTPAGLAAALTSLREIIGGSRLICVFGCGGDRDRGKRPEMGAVAGRLADLVVLTSDNPRSEDPSAIIDEIRSGLDRSIGVVVEEDRARAIRAAIAQARSGDVVLVAGKGHETTQTLGTTVLPFDDRVEAARALAEVAGDLTR